MFNTDMVLMQAYPDIRRSLISDLWSTKNITPLFDEIDNYFNNIIVADTARDMQIFYFSRELDTGDAEQDFAIEVDKEHRICFALNLATPDFI
jgi:hypothetical protein